MSNWKIGQKLVCVGDDNRWLDNAKNISNGPKISEVVTVSGWFFGFVMLIEYERDFDGVKASYDPEYFRPLQGEPAKAELLSSFREVVESPDCPINVPQTETV